MRKKKYIKIITMDVETYSGLIGDLKKIAIYDGYKIHYSEKFSDIEEILLSYKKQDYDVHIYVHNLEFDARKIPEIFSDDKIIWNKCFSIKDSMVKITTKDYVLHDSFALLPMSLKEISEDFDLKDKKIDLWDAVEKNYPNQYKDEVDFLDRCSLNDPLFLDYLGHDVKSLYEIIMKLMEITKLDYKDFVKIHSTAGISRKLFKDGYGEKQFKNPRNSRTDYEMMCRYKWHMNADVDGVPALDIENKIRETYAGGRVEVFKPLLNKKGYHYDENSIYGNEMACNLYPIDAPRYYNKPEIIKELWEDWIEYKDGLGFIWCTVFVPMQHIPPLPVKKERLFFPCGYIVGGWTYVELEYAIKECGVEILEFHEMVHFRSVYPVFKNFVNEFYGMKERATIEENRALRAFSKLILVTGYGYTGMRRDDKVNLKNYRDLKKYQEKDQVLNIDNDHRFIEIQADIRAEYIQVQVAAYVTSYARINLLKVLKCCKGDVYYCDTDSIVTDKPLPKKMIDDLKIGKWKLESRPDRGIFLRLKVYAEQIDKVDKIIFKGISKQQQLNYEKFEKILLELQKEEEERKENSILIEEEKIMLPKIKTLQKNNLEYNFYKKESKSLDLTTKDKRVINYKENYSNPIYFKNIDDFNQFTFKTTKNLKINLFEQGKKEMEEKENEVNRKM